MRLTPTLVLTSLILGVAATPVTANTSSYTVDVAVDAVTPRYRYDTATVASETCRVEAVRVYEREPYRPYRVRHPHGRGRADGGAVLIGGLLGGLVGNRVGDGGARPALTLAGAALGATIAGDLSRSARYEDRYDYRYDDRHHGRTHYERRCYQEPTRRSVRVIDGYDVSYRYGGQSFRKWVREHPGATLPVTVTVSPLR